MIIVYIESAKSDRSKCVQCDKPIKKSDLRLRLKVTEQWGFNVCEKCVDEFVPKWQKAKD